MRHSIRAKLTIIILLLTAGTIISCWFINDTFLEDFYFLNKQDILEDAYYEVGRLLADNSISEDEISLELEKLGANNNITYIIMKSSEGVPRAVFYNVQDPRTMEDILLPYLFGVGNSEIIKSNSKFSLRKARDTRYKTNYLELSGGVSDGAYMLLRTPIESIRESVEIANRFLGYAGCVVVVLSAVIMIFITGRFVKPILELADISEKMSHLNFDIKYKRKDKNEIGVLGNSMNRLSEKLETTISELKSANNELQKDIEQKIQIDEMRKDFLSNVSHELKTPIALIQGYAEGLLDGINDDDKESRQFYCEVIIDEAGKMNKMVKKLLTLNQIEFGNNQVTMERFDLHELVRGVLQSVEILAKQDEIQIIYNNSEPIYVWADEYQIEEVVTNYLSNAIHYATGEKRIELKMEKRDDLVHVSVFNTGERIPKEDIDKVWIKFYKVDKARTREYGGSGIGLSIVKAIMDAHHMQCGVQNRENGVEFWFELDGKNV